MSDVTIRVTIGAVTIEVAGPPEYADKKFDELSTRFFSARIPGAADTAASIVPLETGGKKMSPAEFLKKTASKNQFDRALVMGYYLERSAGVPSFTSTELGQLGSGAGKNDTKRQDIRDLHNVRRAVSGVDGGFHPSVVLTR